MLKFCNTFYFLIIMNFLFSSESDNADSTLIQIDSELISNLKKEKLSNDEKVFKELEYLNSGNKFIEKYEINDIEPDITLPIDFHLGILLPMSNNLKTHSNIGYSFSSNISIPFIFNILKKEIQNSIYLDYSRIGKSLNIASVLFKNSYSFEKNPLSLIVGSGLSKAQKNYFTNTLDISYRFPNENFKLFINLGLRFSWDSFNLKNNIIGINIKYSRLFKF